MSDEDIREHTADVILRMSQVCLDLHAALGVAWGDDPYARIKALKDAEVERDELRRLLHERQSRDED